MAERLLFHRPDNFAIARELAATYIARKNPRLALAKLQAALKAAPRDPQNITLLAEAMVELDPRKAISVWRELAEIHAEALGRTRAMPRCAPRWRSIPPTGRRGSWRRAGGCRSARRRRGFACRRPRFPPARSRRW